MQEDFGNNDVKDSECTVACCCYIGTGLTVAAIPASVAACTGSSVAAKVSWYSMLTFFLLHQQLLGVLDVLVLPVLVQVLLLTKFINV